MKEEYAYVLDTVPGGSAGLRSPSVQAVGESYFTLLALIPKPGSVLLPGDRVYVGKGERDKIKMIKGRIWFSKLTNLARNELPRVLETIVRNREQDFVKFFNTAGSITPRLHRLELLPGIGKKHVMAIIEERKKKPFESLKEMEERIRLLPDPVECIVKRIIEELEGRSVKYRLFVPDDRERRRMGRERG